MIRSIEFISSQEMKRVKPSESVIIISVLDSSEEHARRKCFKGFRGVLKLSFEDTYEELKLARAGDWPDEPSDAENAMFCQHPGERLFSISDAVKIIRYLCRYYSDTETFDLIVHCYAGSSRSAAIALWCNNNFSTPIKTNRSTVFANRRVLRILDNVFSSKQYVHQM